MMMYLNALGIWMNFKQYYVATLENENGEMFYEYSSGPHDYGTAWDAKVNLSNATNKEYYVVSTSTSCTPE